MIAIQPSPTIKLIPATVVGSPQAFGLGSPVWHPDYWELCAEYGLVTCKDSHKERKKICHFSVRIGSSDRQGERVELEKVINLLSAGEETTGFGNCAVATKTGG